MGLAWPVPKDWPIEPIPKAQTKFLLFPISSLASSRFRSLYVFPATGSHSIPQKRFAAPPLRVHTSPLSSPLKAEFQSKLGLPGKNGGSTDASRRTIVL